MRNKGIIKTRGKLESKTLKRGGRALKSFNRNESPIIVAMLQCCTVGVNVILFKHRFV